VYYERYMIDTTTGRPTFEQGAREPNLLVLLAGLRGTRRQYSRTPTNVYYEQVALNGAMGEAVSHKGVAAMAPTSAPLPAQLPVGLELVTADSRGLARRRTWGEANTFAKPVCRDAGASAIGNAVTWRDVDKSL